MDSPSGDAKRIVPLIGPPEIQWAESIGNSTLSYIWRSCCTEMDSRALLFFSQLTISLVVLIFCIYEISVLSDSQWAKMTATFIIGVRLPSPRANK